MFNKFKYILRKNMLRSMMEDDITYEELEEKRLKGITILDVRSPQEYREGHIDGAILIPEYELKFNLDKLPNDKKSEIVVYCLSGARSRKSCDYLKSIGYKNVYNLFGGLQNM